MALETVIEEEEESGGETVGGGMSRADMERQIGEYKEHAEKLADVLANAGEEGEGTLESLTQPELHMEL
jgi:hypothetical protein